ncbi:MAG: zinc-binding alcohol dehydrogenase family protein [Sediminibacterium sp.]|jgi:2-desacetyl-2-hydroxyethyl bacteriochlorophyllide A dehydrogenase|nr:zinc-binding alcohol dehydrogenase family protein [Sediminibacterium sp.]
MKALVCTTPHQFDYTVAPMPVAGEGETLLKIERIGICGTDLHAYEGTQPYFNYPRILGHELAATIVETKAVGFTAGDKVTIIPYMHCGACIACKKGKQNCCVNMQVFGVHIDGGMREFVTVPDTALVKSGGLSLDELALVEPLAIGAHAIKRANIVPNEFVLVMGAGPIGIGIAAFAKIAGAQVILIDVNDSRLDFCKNLLDIKHTINPLTQNVVDACKLITHNDMPTVVMDATGNLNAINYAFAYLAHGGRYVLVGLQKEHISFSHPEFHKREATLMSSRNANSQDFNYVIDCIKKGLVKPSSLITHKVSFSEVSEHFESWLNPATGVVKAMVVFE